MCILWLDDVRKPWLYGYTGATWAKTAREAIAMLKTKTVTFASLDHDLSEARTVGLTHKCVRCGNYCTEKEMGFLISATTGEKLTTCPSCGSMSVQAEETGFTVLNWLEDYPEYWPVDGVRIHTANVSMYQPMRAVVFKHYGRNFEE